MKKKTYKLALLAMCGTLALVSCSDDDPMNPENEIEVTRPTGAKEEGVVIGGDKLMFRVTSETEKTVEVVGTSGVNNETFSGSIIIPGEIEYEGKKYTVTSIGNAVFSGSKITSVEIPNSVTSIGNAAFSGTSLTSIKIPDSVTDLGVSAFCCCEDLTSADLGNSLKSRESTLFENCTHLKYVNIPNSVTSIGSLAFDNCI